MNNIESGFYVEHADNAGWFLFQFARHNDTLRLVWSTKIETCRCWAKRSDVEYILKMADGLLDRSHVVDLTTKSGYNRFFK